MLRSALLTAAVLVSQSAIACNDHDLQDPTNAVRVLQPSLSVSKSDGPLIVTVLGTFQNTTPNKVSSLVVEAKLSDAQGKVVDILTQQVYGVVVPPGEQVAFRLQGPAAAPQAAYSAVQARVTTGEAHAPASASTRQAQPQKAPLLDFLWSWGPMILLILVWIVLARKYSGKASTQDKMLLAVNDQNALLAKQLAAIEAIAAAAQPRRSDGEA